MAEQRQLLLDFIAQFQKDRPMYEAHCRRAAQMVDALIKQKGIMAIVTSRVKDPDRLLEKLIRRDQDEGRNFQSFDDIYKNLFVNVFHSLTQNTYNMIICQ